MSKIITLRTVSRKEGVILKIMAVTQKVIFSKAFSLRPTEAEVNEVLFLSSLMFFSGRIADVVSLVLM